jgi:hypothetical protein
MKVVYTGVQITTLVEKISLTLASKSIVFREFNYTVNNFEFMEKVI